MIVFLVLIVIIWLASKKSEKIRFWKEKVTQQPFNYYLLIGLLIVGFLFRLDYSDRFGCIGFAEPIFELRNILFSATSIILVVLSFFSKHRMVKLTFVLLELLFWTSKLFLFKGGYVVNILGTADPYISLYDTATLALRLFIIKSLLKANINQIYVLICIVIIMSIKIYIFPLPHSFYVKEREWQTIAENTRNFLTKGEWIENKDTTEKIRIIFFPGNAILYNLQGNDGRYFNVRWNTLEVYEVGGFFSINYLLDYSIDRYDKTKPSKFLIEKHIKLNQNYQIVSINETIKHKE